MEQRNGRIDRHGQKAKEVLVFHFVGEGYKEREKLDVDVPVGELEGDLEFLMRAVRKVEAIREDLGKVGPVIAEQVQEAMLGRRVKLDTVTGRKGCRTRPQDAQDRAGHSAGHSAAPRPIGRNPTRIAAVAREHSASRQGRPAIGWTARIDSHGSRTQGEDGKPDKIPAFRLPALSGSWAFCSEGLGPSPYPRDSAHRFRASIWPMGMTTWCWPT